MMQIEQLVLYSHRGETRTLEFRLGQLNIITGASQTGKSSLTNIFRYCLGGRRANVPIGAISSTVAWYGMTVRIGPRKLFVARPAIPGGGDVSAAMLVIEPDETPAFESLQPNTTASALQDFLAGAIGIEENLNVPAIGQTRNAIVAGFKHSLYYCFQGQGEIANPEVLFHRQNRDFQSQAIRDTLPYFLGAQGLADVRRRQELSERRRELRKAEQRLSRAEAEEIDGYDRSLGLLIEAADAGLLTADDVQRTADGDLYTARALLRTVSDRPAEPAGADEVGAGFETTREELEQQRERAREIASQLQSLEDFTSVANGYETELGEHYSRLTSIGLLPDIQQSVECPVCSNTISRDEVRQDVALVESELEAVARRLELARRDRPRIERARTELLGERTAVLARIADLNATLTSLAETSEVVARERYRINLQSYVRGKIVQYLESASVGQPGELELLRNSVASLRAEVTALEESLDPALLRSRVDSAMARVNRSATQFAQELALEHSEHGVRVDPNRLTVVADTPEGPAFLDENQIGSGLNWVGYHIATYLALQSFFIDNARPVPRFILIDQPSQAFFPQDRVTGGDLDELTDVDRESTKRIYRLLHDTVVSFDGSLQIIALDHAEFDDDWFGDSIVERWRDGAALIPRSWLPSAANTGDLSAEVANGDVRIDNEDEASLWDGEVDEEFDDDPWALFQDNDGNYVVPWTDDEHAGTMWREAGFSPDDAESWSQGEFDIDQANLWRRAGLSVEQAIAWSEAAFDPDEAAAWLGVSFTVRDAVRWRSTGLDPFEAVAWRDAQFSPDEAAALAGAGVDIAAASDDLAEGLSVDESIRRHEEEE